MLVKYFGAESHCGMCKALRPRVESWCREHNAEFAHWDTDKDDAATIRQIERYAIRSIPVVVVTDNGKDWIIHGIDGWNTFVESFERVKDESKD